MSDLPEGWVETTLEEICQVILGQSPPGSSYNKLGDGLPFFQGKAEFGRVRPVVKQWTTDPKRIATEGDVLLSVRAPVGPTNVAPGTCAIGRGLAALHPLGGIDYRYVLHAFRASAGSLAALATGTTFPAVSGAQVRAHAIALAPLREQQRIVAAIEEQFSHLDAAEESLHRARRNLKRFRGTVIAGAVRGDWPIVELARVTREQSYGSSTKATSDSVGGVPILRMGNIVDGVIRFDPLKYIPADHPDVEKHALERGDLLFNRTNSPELVGKSAVFKTGPSRTGFASYLIRVRLTDECEPDWAALVINSPVGRAYVASVRTQQVGQANVNGTKLAAFPLPLPLADEQRRILGDVERQLSLIDAQAAAIEVALKRSASLRRAILERAFTGNLVPQDPSDEPAGVLLERIRAQRGAAKPKRARAAART